MKGRWCGWFERYVGWASTKEDCAKLVRSRAPTANGATMPYTYRGRCYAEFGMRGRNSNGYWYSTMFKIKIHQRKNRKSFKN